MIFEEEADELGSLPQIPDVGENRVLRPTQGFFSVEMNGSHGRSIDPGTEQRIISHLKRKLNRRVEKRLASIYEKEDIKKTSRSFRESEADDASYKSESPRVEERSTRIERPVEQHRDIFKRYNEYGERVAFTPALNARRRVSNLVVKPENTAKPLLKPLTSRESPKILPGALEPLPDIESQIAQYSDIMESELAAEDQVIEDLVTEIQPDVTEGVSEVEFKDPVTGLVIDTSREGSHYSTHSRVPKPSLSTNIEQLGEVSTAELDVEAEIEIMEPVEIEQVEEVRPVSPVASPHIFMQPQIQIDSELSISETHMAILQGRLDLECPEVPKIAKLYISNTGIDTRWELRYFTTELYPKLKHLCLQYNCELQITDMHYAMDDVYFDNHSYVQNCINAVNDSIKTDAVNFITLTSGRVGAFQLPATISADDFEVMYEALIMDFNDLKLLIEDLTKQQKQIDEEKDPVEKSDEDKAAKRKKAQAKRQMSVHISQSIMAKEREFEMAKPELLNTWYRKDDNEVPAVYRLQRISSKFPDINKADVKKRAAAVKQWKEQSARVANILQKYSTHLRDPESRKLFFSSVLEREISTALSPSNPRNTDVCWFRKEFDGINISDEAAGDFLEKEEADKIRAANLNEQFHNNKIVPKKNRENFGLDWIKEGFAPEQLRNHMLYLEKLTDRISKLVKDSLIQMFNSQKGALPGNEFICTLYSEVIQHSTFCQQRSQTFHGRKEELQQVKQYLRSNSNNPLIVHSKPGAGRKALICRVAQEAHQWLNTCSPAVIFRSCGVTSASQNIRQLLFSIGSQLALMFKQDPTLVPAGFRGLVNDFSDRIKNSTADKPIVLIIDSLDQLTDEYDARKLSWLPKELPPHVKIIFSCLPDDKYHVLDSARKLWQKNEKMFIQLPDFPMEDAGVVLTHWLTSVKRTLTDDQYNTIMKAYKDCANPLFLRCAFLEALTWTSYTPAEMYKLNPSVKRIATVAFARMERDHGEILVRRVLGYITAAKKGVTMNELEDLISLDEPVMEELTLQYGLKIRRCPQALLIRLRHDLNNYIVELSVDGLTTLQWSHNQFHEAAAERYLLQRDKAPSYHKALAEYFLGTWFNCNKPTPADEEGVPRYIAAQKLCMTREEDSAVIYNKRALNELPYHFINSQQFDMLKHECLCNYEWLLAKLCGCGIRNIFDDLNLALSIEPKDKDLNILMETFQLSRQTLEKDPRQLGSQLSGRLRSIIAKDVPVTSADPKVYPACHPLMSQIAKSSIPTFYPSTTCLTAPGGAISDILIGHKDDITSVAVTSEGMRAFSTSADDTLKMWDLRTGKVTKSINNVGRNVLQLLVAMENSILITSETNCIRIWSVDEQRCVHTIKDFDDFARIAVSADSKLLICYVVGINVMRTYKLTDANFTMIIEEQLERPDGSGEIDKDKEVIISDSTSGDQILVSYYDDSKAFTQNCKNGEIIHTLQCAEESARIKALSVSGEYFAVGYQFKYLKREMPFVVDVFATAGGAYVRSLRGCNEDNINHLMINSNGSHVLCSSASEHIWSSDIAVWNLETEEHKHLASHTGVVHFAALQTLQYVVTASKGEKTLRVWNLSGSIIKPAPKMKQSIGITSLAPMKDHPRYVVAMGSDNGPLTVWNVAKGKTSGTAVRIEHGLIDPSDIVVIRNTKAIILSDRGIAGTSSVYHSVYIYNLRAKRYERKVSGIFIPSQPHEFRLLTDDLLMGLSENRNQIYIWNLQTGSIAYRIKPSFQPRVEMTAYINQEAHQLMRKRQYTAKMTPWDRRTESSSRREERHKVQLEDEMKLLEEKRKEKENGIEQFIISGDEKVLIASFFSHHLCVYDMDKKDHIQTLENDNSLLHLYVAALTHDGSYLVHTNYDEDEKTSYVTLWDCFEGTVKKRLRNEKDVCAIGISDNAERILFGKGNKELRIWEPYKRSSLRKIQGYSGMDFQFGMNKIFMLKGGRQAIIYAGDISMWDLENGTVLAVYTPDTRVSCMSIAMEGQLLCFGLKDSLSVVSLRLIDNRHDGTQDLGKNIFGEAVAESSDEEMED